MSGNNSNVDRLIATLGFDPARKRNDSNVFEEALKEVKEAENAANKVKAKELITKAIELRTQMDKTEKQYQQNQQKFEKELGKVLTAIEAMSKGKTLPEEPDQTQTNDQPAPN